MTSDHEFTENKTKSLWKVRLQIYTEDKQASEGTDMDIELETYIDAVIDQQNHRNGIFANVMETIIHAIADYRATPNARGTFHIDGGQL